MAHTFKPQADSEYICTPDYCGIIYKSFDSARKLLNAYNVVIDTYAACVKGRIDGYYCFSYKLRPLEDLNKIVKDCELLLFKKTHDLNCEDCFYFISEDTLENLPLRELEDVYYV